MNELWVHGNDFSYENIHDDSGVRVVLYEHYQALEAERDRLREAVIEYVEWHGPSCDDHAADEDPECEVCQKDARLSQALKGGGDE